MNSSKPPDSQRSAEVSPTSAGGIERALDDSAVADATSVRDVALIHGVTSDGGLRVIRRRGDRIEAGAIHPIREGAPIHGEVVSLRPRPDCPALCDVEVHYAPPRGDVAGPVRSSTTPPRLSAPARRKGPAQVATETYRDNWESIWSQSKKKSETLN